MILACVAKCRSSAWIIHTFFGRERPTEEQLHWRSGLFTPIWFWLVRLFYQCQLYTCIRTAYTSFWLVYPNAGFLHELFIHFLSQKGQHKNSYMDSLLFFYPNMILACASVLPVTAASLYTRKRYTWFWLVWPNTGLLQELLVHFLARIGQHKNSYMDVLVFLRVYDSGLCGCSTSASYI